MNLDDWLEAVTVTSTDEIMENTRLMPEYVEYPPGWHAVVTEDGVEACFAHESDAFAWRLSYINNKLNGRS